MPRNPLRKRTPYEQAKHDLLRKARSTAAEATKTTAKAVDPVPEPARRPVLIGVLVAAGAVALALIVKAARSSSRPSSDVAASASVTPTAPLGPTDDKLNDPALKAKVESELFGDDSVPKEKISINAADGVITLRGKLDSADQTTTVTEKTEGIDGVRRVENLLTFD